MYRLSKVLGILLIAILATAANGCGDSSPSGNVNNDNDNPVCGDDVCEGEETAQSCPEDCTGCGNGVLDGTEHCDDDDLGGEDCQSQGFAGGALACQEDCTLDVLGCCQHACEPIGSMQCQGTLLQACLSPPGGCRGWIDQLDCADNGESCRASGTTASCGAACADACPSDGELRCNGDLVETCATGSEGCLAWETQTDCSATGGTCADGTGTPLCCGNDCTTVGETRCSVGLAEIQECTALGGGCLGWQSQTVCGANLACQLVGGVPACWNGGGEDCNDLFVLLPGTNTVAWNANQLDYMIPDPACVGSWYDIDGPDVVLAYTSAVNGYVEFTVENPDTNRIVTVVSGGTCGVLTPELACAASSSSDLNGGFATGAGGTYYLYVADTDYGSAPLPDPLQVTINQLDCATFAVATQSTTPSDGAVDVAVSESLTVTFDRPLDLTAGVVTLTGTGGTNVSLDLAASAPELSFSFDSRVMYLDPSNIFALGETVTVSWTGLNDAYCGNAVPVPSWSFTAVATAPVGENCQNPLTLSLGRQLLFHDAVALDYFSVSGPCGSPVTGVDAVAEYTASVTGQAIIDVVKPQNRGMYIAVYDAACGDFSATPACSTYVMWNAARVTFDVTQGTTYAVYIGRTDNSPFSMPNPLDVTVTERDCSVATPVGFIQQYPAPGATHVHARGSVFMQFDAPVDLTSGIISITGTGGTSHTYDLSNPPPEVYVMGQDSLSIYSPTLLFLGETVTVSWTGLFDLECGNAVPSSGWTYQVMDGSEPGEDCSNALTLLSGEHEYNLYADTNDFLNSPSCAWSVPGPDGVAAFTASFTGMAELVYHDPFYGEVMEIYQGSCGDTSTPVDCVAGDTNNGHLRATFPVTAGTSYWMAFGAYGTTETYVWSPVTLSFNELDCSSFTNPIIELDPPHGSASESTYIYFYAYFAEPITQDVGTITITGDLGTNITYDLTTNPSQVGYLDGDRTMRINTSTSYPASEHLTVSVTGLQDTRCGNPVPTTPWEVDVLGTARCTPGAAGMVGTTQTSFPTGLATGWLSYVEPDASPSGWIYVGNAWRLHRMPKAGGATQDVAILAGLDQEHLGTHMLIDGQNLYVVNTTDSATGVVWRISTDGGSSWTVEDFASFPVPLTDDIAGITTHGNSIYLLTVGYQGGGAPQIWSMARNPSSVPTVVTFEGIVDVPEGCSGFALDDDYFFTACGTGFFGNREMVRIPRTGGPFFPIELLQGALGSGSISMRVADTDTDGSADLLYVRGSNEYVFSLCGPHTPAPVFGTFIDYGAVSGSRGLGFDKTANTLWVYDDDTQELLRFQ